MSLKLFCSKCFKYRIFKDVGYYECVHCNYMITYDEISSKTEIQNEVRL